MNRLSLKQYTGNSSWTCPAGVTAAIVGGRGGSGGGAGYRGSDSGEGGDGCFTAFKIVTVTPNTTYAITMGAGGGGGASGIDGYDGTASTFGSVATFMGGDGGSNDPTIVCTRPRGPTIGGGCHVWGDGYFIDPYGPENAAQPGQASPYALGGAGSPITAAGGAGGDGAGGTGNAGTGSNGGGGSSTLTVSGSGGNGTAGRIIIIWGE